MLARTVGFVAALATAPTLAGTFALVEHASPPSRLRVAKALTTPTEWSAAAIRPFPEPASFRTRYRLALRIDSSDSHLSTDDLDLVLHEVNAIWAQAGICFAMRDARLGQISDDELVLRFVAGQDDLPVFGMFDGSKDMWSLDWPLLEPSPHPTLYPAARTAAHELGHALGLPHYNRMADSIDSLMASGHRGFLLHDFEIARARDTAHVLGVAGEPCGRAVLVGRSVL